MFKLEKIHTGQNPADMLTKGVTARFLLAFKHEGENKKFAKSEVQSIVQQVQQRWSCCDQSPSGILLVVEPNLPYLEILFSCDCNLGVLYTHSPYLGVQGYVLANSFADPWYCVNRSIFPWYFPYKRKHCNTTVYGIVLYWKRDCESVKRKCSGLLQGVSLHLFGL